MIKVIMKIFTMVLERHNSNSCCYWISCLLVKNASIILPFTWNLNLGCFTILVQTLTINIGEQEIIFEIL